MTKARPASVPVLCLMGLVAGLTGLVVGAVAKLADDVTIFDASSIFSNIGIWAVILTGIALSSSTWVRAALGSAIFMTAAMVAYYAVQTHEFGYLPVNLALVWIGLSLTAVPVFTAIVHQGRGTGHLAGLALAFPAAVLLAETVPTLLLGLGTPALHAFDLVSAVVLVVITPRSARARLTTLVAVVPIAFLLPRALDVVWSFIASSGG